MHGAKFQCMPVPATSQRGDPRDLFDKLGIARATQADVVRKDDGAFDVAVAVNRVDAIDERNAQSRAERTFLERFRMRLPPLRGHIRQLGIATAQDGAEEERVDLRG